MNILIVDDEAVMVESIKIGLENNGYRVFCALNAQQALEQLFCEEYRIDLVITDYLMPTMNGLELLMAIRKSHPTLPVIIITAYAETALVIEALKNQCHGFMEKPINPDQLIAEIERVKLNFLQNTKSHDLHQLLPRIVHQINNPLSTISSLAQLIRLNVDNGAALQENVENILAAVKQISLINKEIMNAGRESEGERQPVKLDVLLESCLEMFNDLFVLKDIQVERRIFTHGLWVLGDRFSLEQVFKNLILNAVDAMDGCAEKKLSVTVALIPDLESVEIVVEDTGCGIREELLPKIFKPYFTGKCNGNGLGLEIIKHIVEKHGGAVSVESLVGVGSRFYVHLSVMQGSELRDSSQLNDGGGARDICMDSS